MFQRRSFQTVFFIPEKIVPVFISPSLADTKRVHPIDPNDFRSFEVKVRFENATAKTVVHPSDAPSLLEIGKAYMILDLPADSCSKNHNVAVILEVKTVGKSHRFQCTAKVIRANKAAPLKGSKASKDETERMRATLQLMQYEEADWQKFKDVFFSRQDAISEFLRNVKG